MNITSLQWAKGDNTMKKSLILLIVIIVSLTVLSQSYTFIFKNVQLHYITTNKTTFSVPEDFDVLWVSGVDSWELKKVYQNFPFKIVSLEDYSDKYIQETEDNVYQVLDTREILFFNSQINKWCVTEEKYKDRIKPSIQVMLKNPKNAVISMKSPGSWKVIYEMKSDGTFNKNIEINGTPVGETYLYLVNEYLNLSSNNYIETTKLLSTTRMESQADFQTVAQEAILSQTYTIDLGEVELENNLMNFSISQNKVLSYEDRNVINFSLYTNMSDFTKANIVRYIENTNYNRLGIEIPAGEIWIHEEFDKESFPIKLSYVQDTPIGDTIKIDLGKSWDVQYKVQKLSDVEVKTSNSRITDFLFTIKNYGDADRIINIIANIPNVEINDIKIDGNYRNFKNNSEKGKIDINFDIVDEVTIRLTLKTVLKE